MRMHRFSLPTLAVSKDIFFVTRVAFALAIPDSPGKDAVGISNL